ncbi:MAG: hypothetical protein IJX72_05575 [Clostridia bacterium]|nr:hypothetical protein [Clostridia bacterium]
MDVKQTITQVLIAALSVIGFYGILHGIFESVLLPRQIASAVVIRTMTDAADLDILLCEARRAPHGGRKRTVLLVVSTELLDGRMGVGRELKEEYAILAERYGAEICVLEPNRMPNP